MNLTTITIFEANEQLTYFNWLNTAAMPPAYSYPDDGTDNPSDFSVAGCFLRRVQILGQVLRQLD